jgi:glutamate-1-semialdehyde aminotransferase
LCQIEATPGFYEALERLGARLEAGLSVHLARGGYPCWLARVGSMWTLFFTADEVMDWTRA